jgi:hypothetical protein
MNRGAKLFLALAGAATGVGIIAAFTSKSAKAATLPPKGEPEPGVVVAPSEPGELGPPIVLPDPPPDLTLDVNAASRALLRWWAAEGESLLFSEEDREVLRSRGFPVDFGTAPDDLSSTWTPRKADMAAAFQRLNGLSPADGAPTKKLFDALARWVKSQELPAAPSPSSPTEPVPQIITAPDGGEPIVVVPEPAPAPVALPQGGPPPFVPPLPQAPPAAAVPPLAVPVVLPTAAELQQAAQAAQGAMQQAALPVLASLPPLPAAPAPALLPVAATPDVTAPTVVSTETAELVAELLAAEAANNWKRKSAAVTRWQQKRGLKADGRFGPKTALAVAREIGTLPIVRYWPAGSQPHTAVPAFRGQVLEIAAAAPEPRASQLRLSAQREDGQGFGNNQKALPPAARVQINQVA